VCFLRGAFGECRLKQTREGVDSLSDAFVVWLTGLSCSGKTTLARAVAWALRGVGHRVCVLDGDEMRKTPLGEGVGFAPWERLMYLERIAEVARLLRNNGVWVICAFVSPSENMRQRVFDRIGRGGVLSVYVSCPVEVCEQLKGMYARARRGRDKRVHRGCLLTMSLQENLMLSCIPTERACIGAFRECLRGCCKNDTVDRR